MKDKLLLIDANSLIHRAYHALPPLTGKDGEPVGGVYGSLLVLFRILSDINPRYIVASFDLPGKTFRHEKYKEYKAGRPKTPEDLCLQVEKLKEVFNALGISVLAKKGYEADDVIGTLCSLPKETEKIIVSGDADLLQLVDDDVSVYVLRKGVKDAVLCGKKEVEEKYDGISPGQVVEMKALKGDSSDNIPGVKGVGEKTAINLIKQFGNLENLYSSIKESPESVPPTLHRKLLDGEKQAFLSRELSEIEKDIPLEFSLENSFFEYDREKISLLFEEMGFKSLNERIFPSQKENKRETGKLL